MVRYLDEDRLPDGTSKPVTKDVRDRLVTLQSTVDFQVQWTGDLETCLGKSQGEADPAWQAKHIEPKSIVDLQNDHPDYFKACDAVREWVLR